MTVARVLRASQYDTVSKSWLASGCGSGEDGTTVDAVPRHLPHGLQGHCGCHGLGMFLVGAGGLRLVVPAIDHHLYDGRTEPSPARQPIFLIKNSPTPPETGAARRNWS
ncbi:hypothetical protein JZ751_028112 [Albula glossodonta]|uniref:Uncharacterized protein n=1 Tax=Albula glossodonta TaxID=121402 RepID=A0A8T2PAQ2_9TELE|nr:hypothetical protein JZ751_028112 [Albula glossodonta]